MSPRIITLTTDFGMTDAYVGIMKGVILAIARDATIVDLSHEVRPQYVTGAAYLLQSAYKYFPPDTIHVAVVDPGVGTSRKAIAIRTPRGVLVGPDNGLFCPLLADQDLVATDSGRLHGEVAAVELTEHRFWLDHVSQTFHGRDIFAPAAAHLATGVDLNRLGAPLLEIHCIAQQLPTRRDDRLLVMVIHVDRFGNAITNIRADVLPEQPVFEIGGRSLPGLATSYQDARMVAIEGSTGLVEIAVRNASAADTLGLRVGDAVLVRSAV